MSIESPQYSKIPIDIPTYRWTSVPGTTDQFPIDKHGNVVALGPYQWHNVLTQAQPHPNRQTITGCMNDISYVLKPHGDQPRAQELVSIHRSIGGSELWESTLKQLAVFGLGISQAYPIEFLKDCTAIHIRGLRSMASAKDNMLLQAARTLLKGRDHLMYMSSFGGNQHLTAMGAADILREITCSPVGHALLNELGLTDCCLDVPRSPHMYCDLSRHGECERDLIARVDQHIANIPPFKKNCIGEALIHETPLTQKLLTAHIMRHGDRPSEALLRFWKSKSGHYYGKKYVPLDTELIRTDYLADHYQSTCPGWPHVRHLSSGIRLDLSYIDEAAFRAQVTEEGIVLPIGSVVPSEGLPPGPSCMAPISMQGDQIHIGEPLYSQLSTVVPVLQLNQRGRPVIPEGTEGMKQSGTVYGGDHQTSHLLGAIMRYIEDGTAESWKVRMQNGMATAGGKEQRMQAAQVLMLAMMQSRHDQKQD